MTVMKRVVVALGAAALSVSQMGCVDPCAGQVSGKRNDLNFQVPQVAAQGLGAEVQLLRWVSMTMFEGPAFYTRDPLSCYQFDNADIEVTLPAALNSAPAVVQRPANGDVNLVFTCGAETADPQEVNVRVLKNGEVLNDDAFDITCHPLAAVQAAPTPGNRPMFGDKYVVGGVLDVSLDLKDASGGGLTGFGAVPADSMLVSLPREPFAMSDKFRVAAPGQFPVLQVGPLTTQVDVGLVASEQWEMGINKFPTTNANLFQFSAVPKAIGGAEQFNGVEECKWTAFVGTESEVLPDTTCDIEHSNALGSTNRIITKMCVESLGHSGCLSL